jgi:hypothetical protein
LRDRGHGQEHGGGTAQGYSAEVFCHIDFIFQPQMKMIAHQAKQDVAAVRRDF